MSDDEEYDDEQISEVSESEEETDDEIDDTESDISTIAHDDVEHIVTAAKPIISRPVMTRFEYARIKGILMTSIEDGYDVGEVPPELVTTSQIATWLIEEKKFLPFTLLRPTRGSEMEPVDASSLIIL